MADATYQPKVYRKQGGDYLVVASSGELTVESGGAIAVESGGALNIESGGIIHDDSLVRNTRHRVTIAEINAGHTLLAAAAGYKYRMVDCKAIAYGGAAGAVTTVDILGTQGTSSVKLVAFAQANLTQSTVLTAGGTGGTVLADGASFVACDAASAITIGKTGSDVTTATGVDVILSYTLEAA